MNQNSLLSMHICSSHRSRSTHSALTWETTGWSKVHGPWSYPVSDLTTDLLSRPLWGRNGPSPVLKKHVRNMTKMIWFCEWWKGIVNIISDHLGTGIVDIISADILRMISFLFKFLWGKGIVNPFWIAIPISANGQSSDGFYTFSSQIVHRINRDKLYIYIIYELAQYKVQ